MLCSAQPISHGHKSAQDGELGLNGKDGEMSYHKVIVVGYLGRDPEMRYTPSGTPVTNFSVAASRKWKNQDGSDGEETVWFRVTAWRQLAETCNQYLSKGRLVLVEGLLKPGENGSPRVYQRQDGAWAAQYELTASTIKFLGGRGERVDTGFEEQEEPPAGFIEENDIPF
jgi:single-strand DNA-binding protein